MVYPFWPRTSPHFLACRVAVRPYLNGQPVTVGLSGGADSLALCAALSAEGAEVEALVVDHGLQEGSDAVAKTAAATARALGTTARVISVEVPARGSMEAAARRARYAALRDAAAGREVFIAHTADDAGETLLLSALRGQAAGLAPRALIEGAAVVRPLLGVRRADTAGACAELGLEPWQDPHNERVDFLRVALRKEVIPRLGELIGGDAVPALAQAAGKLVEDNAALQPGAVSGDCAVLAGMEPAVRRRAIGQWLRGHGVLVTTAAVEAIAALCTSWRGQGPVAVSAEDPTARQGRVQVRRVDGHLRIEGA